MTVEIVNAHPGSRVRRALATRFVLGALRGAGRSRGSITVVFVNDSLSRRLNRRFLAHDRPTDVIAFPLGEEPNLDGEIYVNLDKARRQARTYHVTVADEIARLIIHGTLHLLGYDDRTRAKALRMKAREDLLVDRLTGTQKKEIHERKSR
jgi:probable rRNA maturation factor